eukprot:2009597-Prymnesium_polylepis.1
MLRRCNGLQTPSYGLLSKLVSKFVGHRLTAHQSRTQPKNKAGEKQVKSVSARLKQGAKVLILYTNLYKVKVAVPPYFAIQLLYETWSSPQSLTLA